MGAPAPGAAAGAGATPAIVAVRQGPEKEGARGGGGFSGFAYSVRRH